MGQSYPADGSDALIARLKHRDPEAWDEAFSRFGPRVIARIRAAIHSRNWFLLKGEEEDLLIAVFVRAIERCADLRCQDEDSFLAYLNRITITICIDELRKKRLWESLDESTPVEPVDDAEAVEAALVRQAVAELEPELRQVIEPTLEGFTWKEICAQLGIVAKEFWRRKYKALKLLRTRLIELGVVCCQESGRDQRLLREEGPRR